MGDERCFTLIHCIIHIHPALADLHVLEARLDTFHHEGGRIDEGRQKNWDKRKWGGWEGDGEEKKEKVLKRT